MAFASILYLAERDNPNVSDTPEPEYFPDLNLDQLVAAIVGFRAEYGLQPYFYAALTDAADIEYRHEVVRDLGDPQIAGALEEFAKQLRVMRGHLQQIAKLHYQLQKQIWFRDCAEIYCDAVRRLLGALTEHEPESTGLLGLRTYLQQHVGAEYFDTLARSTAELRRGLGSVDYTMHVRVNTVRVSRFNDEADYSEQVLAVFDKFKQGAVKSYLVDYKFAADMNHVEAGILNLIAKLCPDIFGTLGEFCTRYAEFQDPVIRRFDREVQFYLAYLQFTEHLRTAGLPFCLPGMSPESKAIEVRDAYDLALAESMSRQRPNLVPATDGMLSTTAKSAASRRPLVVPNDMVLSGAERLYVVTGPNSGGKTTFARTFGQLHHLGCLGLPVPGTTAQLFIPDRIFTHFEKQEDAADLRGKLQDDLVRIHSILQSATPRSVVILNEIFNSTTLEDAQFLGRRVLEELIQLDALGVCVTFVDELASLGEATVSVASTIALGDPTKRTFRVVRKPADGLAYAVAIAEKHGLTYQRIRERMGPAVGEAAGS